MRHVVMLSAPYTLEHNARHVVMLGIPYVITYSDPYLMGPPRFALAEPEPRPTEERPAGEPSR